MLTRRQFLSGAATVIASAAAGCSARLPRTGGVSRTVPARPVPDAPGPDQPLRIALISDPHCQPKTSGLSLTVNSKLAAAAEDLAQFAPDLWIANGDLADHGATAEHEAFREIMARVAPADRVLVTTGNHEFYDMEASDEEEIRRFLAAYGKLKPYSSHIHGGVHFVMLADEQWKTAPKNRDWAWLTPEQLRWFEKVLAEQKERLTIVCLHQPLQDTVVWSGGGNNFAGTGQLKEIREITGKNPQIRLWFSGHTHQRVQEPGQVVASGRITYVGLASTFYNFVPSQAAEDQGGWPAGGGYKKSFDISQSRLLEIYPDRIVIKARDHTAKAWLTAQEAVVRRV